MSSFHIGPIRHGLIYDRFESAYPTRVYAWSQSEGCLSLHNDHSSYFGYVQKGYVVVRCGVNKYTLGSGQYFAFQEAVEIEGGAGLVVERGDYRVLNLVGGPLESNGRLRYIDGCTDTLLVPPVKRGDACLNALYFPTGIDQTTHTHPSIRVGIVASGRGLCVTESDTTPLLPGDVFLIDKDAIHGFRTGVESGMVIIAYHPDSDFGPVDDDHPMINRTLVEGISAARIDEIRTQ